MTGVDKQQAGGEVIHRIAHILRIVAQLRAQRVKMLEKMGFVVVVAVIRYSG